MNRTTRLFSLALLVAALASAFPAVSAERDERPSANRTSESRFAVPDRERPALRNGMPARSIDGSGNNLLNPEWGQAGRPLRRAVAPAYADGVSAPSGSGRPGPRAVSNAVLSQPQPLEESSGLSDMFWLWGQFLDHDIGLTEVAEPLEPMPIAIPAGDPWFDPDGAGDREMPFERSIWDSSTGTGPDRPREQVNVVTTWIDGSQIYGSDPVRAEALRTLDGTGRLKTSAGDLLPYNIDGLP
ncbi:MAG: peroxidase family protein, partial [Wenzhouxiangellaceae bacterium]|nr:peroxidase family protein [Wenzhouxiangellaceae bacterium]